MPRIREFNKGRDLLALFSEFCDEIRDNDYNIVPNKSQFLRWLDKHDIGVCRTTIWSCLNKYFGDLNAEWMAILSDLLAEGMVLGKYNSSATQFALKNWCRWTDKQEIDTKGTNTFEINIKDTK